MPAYQSRMAMPPTPPEYAYSDAYYQSQYPTQQMSQEYEYQQTYMAPYSSTYQQGYSVTGADTTLPSISTYYEPIGAPILPPLRMQDRVAFSDSYRVAYEYPRAPARQPKEDRAVGGVSAKLDYDMDRMTNFVVSTTQHMYDLHCSPICLADIDITRSFQQNISSPPAFRKWVHQVLSATRLPSATILLSLHYLSDRLKVFPQSVPISENQIYRLLAVALILGSKFLDDNTFINRSWSDVTAIKVSELNTLEIKWLGLIEYGLHVDSSCVQTWLELWSKYDLEQSREQTRLSPLDTTMRSTTRRYSPYPTPYSSSTMSSRTFEHTPTSAVYRSSTYTPDDPWAPASRPVYEDYYKRTSTRYPMLSDFDEANNRRIYESRQSYYPTPQSAGYTTWDMQNWYGHRADCTCSNCAYRAWKPYTGYSMGTVMG